MHLRFSRSADYGLRAATVIGAAPPGALVTRTAIAAAVDAPASVVAQALALLVRAGLLIARAGPGGGYRLARPADSVSIYDIVVAIDAERDEQRCVLREGACSMSRPCPFHAYLIDAQHRFLESLRSTTLADVLATAATPRNAPGTARRAGVVDREQGTRQR